MRTLHRLVALTVMLLVAAAGLLTGPLVQTASAAPSESDTYESTAQTATNSERTDRDLAVLKASTCLDGYAEKQAKAMADSNTMYHQDLKKVLKKCKLSQVGENVAYGFVDGDEVTQAWMDSPGHRANILNTKNRLIGMGAYQATDGTWYVSQVMGRAL